MKENNEITSVEIFTGTIWQVQMVKSLLENAEIEVFLQDEITGTLNLPWASSGGSGLVRVIVPVQDYERAKLIVDEYERNME